MNYIVLDNIKQMYKNGFRCIHTDTDNSEFIIQLKNFQSEEIQTLTTSDLYEINMIKSYLEQIQNLHDKNGCEY